MQNKKTLKLVMAALFAAIFLLFVRNRKLFEKGSDKNETNLCKRRMVSRMPFV